MENIKDNKVAICTSFYMTSEAYSLCNVVLDQLKMFTMHDYKIKLIVDENMPDDSLSGAWKHSNITLEKVPSFSKSNDGILPPDYEQEVDKVYNALKEILKDCSVVLTHDLVLMPAELIMNMAARRLAGERTDIRWLHMSHSSTAPEVRCSDESARAFIQQKFPNSFMLYPNSGDKKRVALNYGYELDEVKTVHHQIDIPEMMFGKGVDVNSVPNLSDEAKSWIERKVNYPVKLTKDFVKEFDILNADVISMYPARLDRGKQVEFNIKTMAKIKEAGRTVRMIVCDFHSNSKSPNDDKYRYREELKKMGQNWGLELNKELIFVSEWRENTNLEVPREFIMNLNKISDFKMHPSTSETFSLVCMEAMMWRNFCVLNHHTNYMKSIYGEENVLYEEFGSAMNMLNGEDGATNIEIHDEKIHFENLAKKVLYFIEKANPVIAQWRYVRQNFNLEKVFKTQLEPLLFYQELK